MEARIKRVEVNGIGMEYVDFFRENVPVLVFLHGMGDTKESFKALLFSLKDEFRLIAVDLRGHGNTTKKGPFTFEQLVEDIYGLLEYERIEKVSFVTASFSGATAQIFAARYPKRVEKLVIIDGGYYELNNAPGFNLEDVVKQVDSGYDSIEGLLRHLDKQWGAFSTNRIKEAFILRYEQRKDGRLYRKIPDEASAAYTRAYATANLLEEVYPKVQAPVLLIQSDITLLPSAYYEFLEKSVQRYMDCLCHVQVERIPNSHHLVMLTHPKECSDLTFRFMTESKSPSLQGEGHLVE